MPCRAAGAARRLPARAHVRTQPHPTGRYEGAGFIHGFRFLDLHTILIASTLIVKLSATAPHESCEGGGYVRLSGRVEGEVFGFASNPCLSQGREVTSHLRLGWGCWPSG